MAFFSVWHPPSPPRTMSWPESPKYTAPKSWSAAFVPGCSQMTVNSGFSNSYTTFISGGQSHMPVFGGLPVAVTRTGLRSSRSRHHETTLRTWAPRSRIWPPPKSRNQRKLKWHRSGL